MILFSTSPEFFAAAESQLRAALPAPLTITRLDSDTGLITHNAPTLHHLSRECSRKPLAFIRHLASVARVISTPAGDRVIPELTSALTGMTNHLQGQRVALQLWTSGSVTNTPLVEISRSCKAALIAAHVDVVPGKAPMTVHVCITPLQTCIGLANSQATLSDWPGGRVRLRKMPDQVSRAALKLEEAIAVFDLALERGATAVDLGASPGSWTQVLRRHGVIVHAVDPAALAPSVLQDQDVIHHRVTAQEFLANTGLQVELIVNDMRMSIADSCELMLGARRCLKHGAMAVMTLKISEQDAVRAVEDAIATLRGGYRVRWARQLYHNRREVTVVLTTEWGTCRADGSVQ